MPSPDATAKLQKRSTAIRHPVLQTKIAELRTGRVKPLGAGGVRSAIDKNVHSGPLKVGREGLVGDEQADRNFHGGPEKAVLHYAIENYDAWHADGYDSALFRPGAFGENVVSRGLNETNICIGDIFEAGSAILQVSQPRQPCFKLNHRFQLPGMARRVQQTGRTGWYYRVLTPGTIEAGEDVRLIDRQHPEWTLRRVQHHLYVDMLNEKALSELVALDDLSEPMRQILGGRLRSSTPESWDARLIGIDETASRIGDEDRAGWRIARVDRIADQSANVKLIRLVDQAARTLEHYPPGAHISIELPGGIVRDYSLCGLQDNNGYEIAVLHVSDGTGGSRFVHQELKVGDIVSISPPKDRFSLASEAGKHLMIAGGVGITPFVSMIEHCVEKAADFELHYCVRSKADTLFRDRLGALLPGRLSTYHSREPGGGRLDVAELLRRQDTGTHVYCCGPKRLMRAVREATADWHKERVHFEHFAAKKPAGVPFRIKLASSGQVLEVGAGVSVMQVLRKAGISVASSCETGSCGTCCMGLLSGEADHRDVVLSENDRQISIAVCVSRARHADDLLTLDL